MRSYAEASHAKGRAPAVGILICMAQSPEPQAFEVDCPHCKKSFTAELMRGGGAARHHGFKCPHCRLFVSYERADEQERLDPRT